MICPQNEPGGHPAITHENEDSVFTEGVDRRRNSILKRPRVKSFGQRSVSFGDNEEKTFDKRHTIIENDLSPSYSSSGSPPQSPVGATPSTENAMLTGHGSNTVRLHSLTRPLLTLKRKIKVHQRQNATFRVCGRIHKRQGQPLGVVRVRYPPPPPFL